MVPPHGDETGAGRRVDVDKARRVAGDAFLRNGHMALDCRRTASIVLGVVVRGCQGRMSE